MGLRDKYAKKIEERGFRPIDLNEENVQVIFNRCGKYNEDGDPELNEEALEKNRANIRCLLGQLALVHEGVREHALDGGYFQKYDGGDWTDNGDLLIKLLNMGGHSHFCSFLEKDGRKFVKLEVGELTPTLSSQDPKFAVWWEGADGLLVRAKVAEDENKQAEAFSLYEKAAELGHTNAQYHYGSMYYTGKGTAVDYVKALYWSEKAAEQGHAKAQDLCYVMYSTGRGTAADEARAMYWSEKAAQQGDAMDQAAHGYRCHRKGDKAKALYWLEKAAEQGYPPSQTACGIMYYDGEGTARDRAKAKLWIEKAAAQTEDKMVQEDAKKLLRELF